MTAHPPPRHLSRSPLVALGTALSTLLLASCATVGHNYHDQSMDFASVRTVAVMPFTNLSREPAGGERVRDVFASMLLATGSVYVLPSGEVARGITKVGISAPAAPSAEEVVKLGGVLQADAVITGVVKEYGQVGSGAANANVIAVSVQLVETTTGKVVWSASSTKGGVKLVDRLLGSGGAPLNDVTEEAVDDLLDRLFR